MRSADRGHLDFPRVKRASYEGRSLAYAGPSCLPVQAVSEDIFIRTVRPRRIVNCLTAPPRNILTYLLTYLP